MIRNFFSISLIVAFTAFNLSAQFKVTSNGQVQVGIGETSDPFISDPSDPTLISSNSVGTGKNYPEKPDTTAALYIKGKKGMDSGGRIAFGKRGNVYIEESTYNSSLGIMDQGSIILNAKG